MTQRFIALLCLALFLLVGCAAGGGSSRVSSSAAPINSPVDYSARIEEHFDRIECQATRVERLHRRLLHIASSPQQPFPDLRARFADYRQADRQQRRFFAAHGITTDAEYYRLQHRVLDAFSVQLRQLEELLTSIRNERNV